MPFIDGILVPEPQAYLKLKIRHPLERTIWIDVELIVLSKLKIDTNKYNDVTVYAETNQDVPFVKVEEPKPAPPPIPPSQQMLSTLQTEPWATMNILADALYEENIQPEVARGLRALAERWYVPNRISLGLGNKPLWENDLANILAEFSLRTTHFLDQSPEICHSYVPPQPSFPDDDWEEEVQYAAKQFDTMFSAIMAMATAVGRALLAREGK